MSEQGSDKRSVSTDALETLGTIIDKTQKRDAIHLAVEPVKAGERLLPGDHITVKDGIATSTNPGAGLGIVDPFLEAPVLKNQYFWFVMYPRKVKSLRHVWTHPAFPDEPMVAAAPTPVLSERSKAERWIRDYAEGLNVGYVDLLQGAQEFLDHGEYLVRGGLLEGISTSSEFWQHFETVTGRKVDEDQRENFFSCSC